MEMTKPREALDEAGAETKIVSLKSGKIQGMNHMEKGDEFDVDRTLDETRPEEFDALMIPGGLYNPDAMRMNEKAGIRAAFLSCGQTGRGHLSRPAGSDQRGPCSRKKDDLVAGDSDGHAQRGRALGR
jgi:predicted nucleotidyltransferase